MRAIVFRTTCFLFCNCSGLNLRTAWVLPTCFPESVLTACNCDRKVQLRRKDWVCRVSRVPSNCFLFNASNAAMPLWVSWAVLLLLLELGLGLGLELLLLLLPGVVWNQLGILVDVGVVLFGLVEDWWAVVKGDTGMFWVLKCLALVLRRLAMGWDGGVLLQCKARTTVEL